GPPRPSPAPRGHGEVRPAAPVEVAHRRPRPAPEGGVGDAEEVPDQPERLAVVDEHAGPAALVGGDDQVGGAVAGQVAGGDVHAPGEGRLERLDGEELVAGGPVE